MARIIKTSILLAKGKVGDTVVRQRRGTPYISSKPLRKKVKQTPALKKVKSVFGFLGKISSQLHADPKIRGMWDASDIDCENARNKISHLNYHLIPDNRDLTNFRLSPFEELFHAPIIETVWGKNKVTVTFGPFEGISKNTNCSVVSARGVVHYFNSKLAKRSEDRYRIDRISSVPAVYRKEEQHTFTLTYDSNYIDEYKNRQFCFTLLIEDRDGIATVCSENIIL